ncbi:pyridoxamine 5'-phosphate oxidase [soil metagenome]
MHNPGDELSSTKPAGSLRTGHLPTDPLALFTHWFADALAADIIEPYAMTLATATPDGRPAARMVLLRGFDEQGFCFYTNYESRKGQELTMNPQAALLFWWGKLERQVRIEGHIEKLTPDESDAYFNSRPLGSRFGAIVSAQSQVIASRAILEERLHALEAEYANQPPPRPPFWGGYRVIPTMIEFWKSGQHRLHDRLRYTRQTDDRWIIERLSP